MNMNFVRKLPIPKELKEQYPLSAELEKIKYQRDREISDILMGINSRFLLIIGPCSADREDSVMDYLCRLKLVQEEVSDKILIIPRLYTSKPRSQGKGYMGFLHQPNPSEAPDILKGISQVREFHLRALSETGFSCAEELLYPENHRYLSDLISYVAVGARSVENQEHRLVASGLKIPAGMKNPVGGNLDSLINSISSAKLPHKFLYRGWEVESAGNPLAHAILRGYKDKDGVPHPNYDEKSVLNLLEKYEAAGLSFPTCIIDTNHDNSGKQYEKQPDIALETVDLRNREPAVKKFVKGLMVESYLTDGCQEIDGNIYGQSITDPCIGWDKTEKLIYSLAEKL